MDSTDEQTGRLTPMGRWLTVLDAFLMRDEWGVRDLADAIDLPKSAVHRILHEMVRLDILSTGQQNGTFRIGSALIRVVTLLSDQIDVQAIARPILEQTTRAGGETSVLLLYAPGRHQFWAVDAVESDQPILWTWKTLRGWGDLHLGAGGKAILAFLPDPTQDVIVDQLDEPIGELRPISRIQLRRQLAETRQRGYAISHGERTPGSVAVAAPVRDAAGRILGALLLGWPESRSTAEKERDLGERAVMAADAISRALGLPARSGVSGATTTTASSDGRRPGTDQ
jgi:DNA-binding IclR family transcriptional regulator